MQEMNTELSK